MKHHFIKTVGSLFGKLVVAKVFGFILTLTIFMAISGTIGSLVTQLCAVMLVVVLLYSTAWELGSKDANRINLGQIKQDLWLGFKAGLLADLIDILLAVGLLLTKAGVIGWSYTVLFSLLNSNFLPLQQALIPTTLTVAEHSWAGYIATAATVLIAPICAGVGYRLGLLQVSLGDLLLYTTPESRERHHQRVKARRGKKMRRWLR